MKNTKLTTAETEQKKIIVHTSEIELKNFKEKIKQAQDLFPYFGAELNAILKKEFSESEILIAFSSPSEFIKNHFAQMIPAIDTATGLPINKEEKLNSLQLPETNTLNNFVSKINVILSQINVPIEKLFDVEFLETKENAFHVYAESQNEIEFFKLQNEAVNSLNKLSEAWKMFSGGAPISIYPGHPNQLHQFIIQNANRKFIPSYGILQVIKKADPRIKL